MNTHDIDIELPQGYAERPFDYSGDLYTEGQVRAIIKADRERRGEPVAYVPLMVANGLPAWDGTVPRGHPFHDLYREKCPWKPLYEAPQPAESDRGEPVGYIMPTALKQLKAGGNAVVGSMSQGCDVPIYTAPQPAEPVAYLDLGVGGYMDVGTYLTDEQLAALPKGRHMLGIIGTYGVDGYREAAPQPAEPVKRKRRYAQGSALGEFGVIPMCDQDDDEPVKVPSDAEMAAIWDEAHKPFGGAPFLMSHVEYSRTLLARYTAPQPAEPTQIKP